MNLMKNGRYYLALVALCALLPACGGGGGGSSGSGLTIEGTLTQGGAAEHSANLKHESGEHIESVQICALGACSVTDSAGQFGFEAGAGFAGGEVLFTVNGHGIDTTSVVEIPAGAKEVIIDFQHAAGVVTATHVTVDGETSHHEDEGHEHE